MDDTPPQSSSRAPKSHAETGITPPGTARSRNLRETGKWVAAGTALGAAVGLALGSLAMGVAFGLGLGAVIGVAVASRGPRSKG